MLFNKLRLNQSEKADARDALRDLISEGILSKNGKYYEYKKRSTFYEAIIILDEKNDYAAEIKTPEGMLILPIKKKNLQTLLGDTVVSIIEYANRDEREAIVEI
jgi:hypothetical protein